MLSLFYRLLWRKLFIRCAKKILIGQLQKDQLGSTAKYLDLVELFKHLDWIDLKRIAL